MSASQPASSGGWDPPARGGKARPAPWDTGTVVGGRYRLVNPIGRGAMGEVWRAEHLTLNTHIALKLVDASAHRDGDEILERFRIEGQAAGRLRSPHVVQIFDYGTERDIAYMAMELLEGETLADRLLRAGRFTIADTARILHEIALGVGQAHEVGVVHRDLKPQNVFLAKVGGRVIVKVLDFGIAKLTIAAPTDTLKTHAGMMVGTPAYMSPEQVMGNSNIDWRSDLWQMGIIAFECVCGKMPFDATSLGDLFMKICSVPMPVPSKVAPVPESFDGWFARAMQREPERRFQSARAMAEALAAIVPQGAARKTVQSEIFRANASNSPWGAAKSGEPSDNKRIILIALLAALSTVVLVSGALWLISRRGVEPPVDRQAQGSTSARPADTAVPALSGAPVPIVSPSAAVKEAPEVPPTSPSTAPSSSPSALPTSGPTKGPKGPRRAEDVFGI